jgi:iron(II)-dependent oxidoreductase
MAGLNVKSSTEYPSLSLARAGREALSLAMMDLRNGLLQVLSRFEQSDGQASGSDVVPAVERPLWIAGHVAWFAEYWIGRNPQRGMGRACPVDAVRLASVEPLADARFNPALVPPAQRHALDLGGHEHVRSYLLETLESTLELLEKAPDDDDSLYFYRVALFHESLRHEQLISAAQALGVGIPLGLPEGLRPRDALLVPAGRWTMGVPREEGFAFDVQRPAHEVEVPEFEIDAQPVTWAQYVEFVADEGYDREDLWLPQGWQWLQQESSGEGRRGPRYVDQIGSASGAVMRTVFGRPARMSGSQSAMHVTWWEADAYARWAGRRLPTEVEWEMAAHAAAGRGFRWGDVREWTAGTLRPWPGFVADAWTLGTDLEAAPNFGVAKVQRGASFATRPLLRDPRQRGFALPHRDDAFVGFRTCAD